MSNDFYPNLSGANHKVILINDDGTFVSLRGLKDFRAQQTTVNRKNVDHDGTPWEIEQPMGWSGSFTVTRRNVVFDELFADDEDAWFDSQTLAFKSIQETITLPGANPTSYSFLYDKVTLKFDNIGDFSGDKDAEMSVSFKAQRRRSLQ